MKVYHIKLYHREWSISLTDWKGFHDVLHRWCLGFRFGYHEYSITWGKHRETRKPKMP